MRHVDCQTNALPDRPTDQPTDTASYRGALSPLKKEKGRNKEKLKKIETEIKEDRKRN